MRPAFPGQTPRAERFERLVRPHLDRLYRLAYRFTGNRFDAEDLVQELCVRLLPKLETLEGLEQAGPWLARALHNLFVDRARHTARSPIDSTEAPPDIATEAPGPERAAMSLADADRIEAALQRLAPEFRAVIVWHDAEGYTLEELAGAEGIPVGTLKSRLHRARGRLRELLREPF